MVKRKSKPKPKSKPKKYTGKTKLSKHEKDFFKNYVKKRVNADMEYKKRLKNRWFMGFSGGKTWKG